MTEWGVVGVLAALAGFAATLVAPVIKLNTTLTRLAVLVEELSDKLSGARAQQFGRAYGACRQDRPDAHGRGCT